MSNIRVGVVAPTFNDDATRAVSFAQHAEALGFDAVGVYDHLYPLGQPQRSALAWLPVLSAIGASTESVSLLPVIARVGIRPNRLLIQECLTMYSLFGDRFIAAFGIGDHQAAEEYRAYGVEYKSFSERLDDAEIVCTQLHDIGVKVWVSAKSTAIQERLAPVLSGVNVWEGSDDDLHNARHNVPQATLSWAGVWGSETPARGKVLAKADCDWVFVSFASDAEAQLEVVADWRTNL